MAAVVSITGTLSTAADAAPAKPPSTGMDFSGVFDCTGNDAKAGDDQGADALKPVQAPDVADHGAHTPRNPPEGHARLYVFRPDVSSMGRHDSPALWMNGQEVAKLDHKTYVDVLVRPGPVRFELKPSVFASASWFVSGTISAREGQKLYLAIWTTGEGGSNKGMGLVPVFGSALPLMPVPTQTPVRMRVLHELVDEADALEAMQGLAQSGADVILGESSPPKP